MELFVVRHGHSPFTATTDHQRTLSTLGQRQAKQSAEFISRLIPQQSAQIICSDAARTLSTANIIHSRINGSQLISNHLYYNALVGDWCDAINDQAHQAHLILVGHNPTMSMLSHHLFPIKSFHFNPACVAHFSLEIATDGLKLPAQLNAFYMPDAIQ